jgi:hypothetical protein
MADESIEERRAKALEWKAKRDAEAKAAAEQAEIEELELEQRFSDGAARRGRDFEIVNLSDLGEGFVVVKLGEAVHHTSFVAGKQDEASVNRYVLPNVVHPTREQFKAIFNRRPQVLIRSANALATLYGVRKEADAGKF